MAKQNSVGKVVKGKGKVWIGGTTTGVLQRDDGGLLFRLKFNINGKATQFEQAVYDHLSKRQAKEQWDEWCLATRAGQQDRPSERPTPSFSELGQVNSKWETYARATLSVSTFHKVRSMVTILNKDKTLAKWTKKPVSSLTQANCQGILNYLRTQKKQSFNQLVRYKESMSSVLSYAKEQGYVDNTVSSHCWLETKLEHRNRLNKQTKKTFATAEVKIIWKYLSSDKICRKMELPLKVAIMGGLRRAELQGLVWDDLKQDEDGNWYLWIRRTIISDETDAGTSFLTVNPMTKNGTWRKVPLGKGLSEQLCDFKKTACHKLWHSGGKDFDIIFCDKKGKPYEGKTFWRWWNLVNDQLVKAGRLKKSYPIQKLRSTGISLWANEVGLSIFDVATLAGHKNISVTKRYYLSSDDKHVRSLSSKMTQLIDNLETEDVDLEDDQAS